MSEAASGVAASLQSIYSLINTLEHSNDSSSVLESAEALIEEFGELMVSGALKNLTMEKVAEGIKDLIDSNDDLGDAMQDIAKSMVDSLTGGEEAQVTADAETAVEDDAGMQELSENWANEILQKIMEFLASENDKENGMNSTEGKADKDKAKAGAEGGGEAAGGAEGGAEGGAAAGGAEGEAAGAGGEEAGGAEGGGSASGGGGSGMNWLEKLAEGMAKAQINWLAKADGHQETMQKMSGKDDTASRDAFIMAQSKYTAAMQMFSMTAAATSTSLKTVGEGLAGIARKQ